MAFTRGEQHGHNVLSPLVKIVTLPFIILADNTEGLYKFYHIHLQYSYFITHFTTYDTRLQCPVELFVLHHCHYRE